MIPFRSIQEEKVVSEFTVQTCLIDWVQFVEISAKAWNVFHIIWPIFYDSYILLSWNILVKKTFGLKIFMDTFIWSLDPEYSKSWVKQSASEHRLSSVGGKVKPSSVHWAGFIIVMPWVSLNSQSTSKAWYSGSGRIL